MNTHASILTDTKSTSWQETLPEELVKIVRPNGQSELLLVCEHASKFIPAGLDRLGLDEAAANSHIAWDPGAMNMAEHLSAAFDATLIAQNVSRLVYDCNRPPDSPDAMRETSEIYAIPGNKGLSDAARDARTQAIYTPFRDALAAAVKNRPATVLVTVHSFTPVYLGKPRAVEVGILHDADSRLADAMLAAAAENPAFITERNAPYGPDDGVTHTLVEHALPRGVHNVMIEVRNDLISDEKGQKELAAWLAEILTSALKATAKDA